MGAEMGDGDGEEAEATCTGATEARVHCVPLRPTRAQW